MSNEAERGNPYTRGMAAFVAGLRFADVPPEVLTRLKFLMLDSLGCAVYGAQLPWSRILRRTLGRMDGAGAAGTIVWGTAERLSAPHAVLVNGMLVQGFELDDVHRVGVMHVGAVTLPPLLALAELRRGQTGQDFLKAAVAGYETGPRVGLCMGPEHIGQGWHSGATLGVFSAAAATAAALGLDTKRTVHALGIAGTQSSGLMAAQYGSMVKRLHAGRAAQSGFYGGMLAEQGFTGITDVFESPYGGFCTTLSRSDDRFDLAELTAELGRRFEIMRVALKFYACVGSNHTTLDAIRTLQQQRPFGPADIRRIKVHGSRVTVDHVGWPYEPQGLTSAQLNLPYCVATLLLEGDVFVDQFTEEAVHDDRRIALSRLVEVAEDPAITARGRAYRHMVRVEVELHDGTRLEETREAPVGSEHSFADEATIINKFKKLTRQAMPESRIERLLTMMLELEKLEDTSRLAAELGCPPNDTAHLA
jgi:2-methylcitrate dehydratase PrpD